ncbi:MAG: hypothetical protein K2I03_09790, partial [Lachnospiraceae bacterium]|nr:hypothetical protein [Lachnospiraceae bacterium]
YQVMINIVILAFEACFAIYFREIEIDKMDDLSKYLAYSELEDEYDKMSGEFIIFCEENQKEIEAISEEFSSIIEADMPYEEYIELQNKITNPDWARISEKLSFRYNADKPWLVEYYYGNLNWKTSEYIFKVYYIDKEKLNLDEYEYKYGMFMYDKCGNYFFVGINDHLYMSIDYMIYV